jgi:uncharacterized membrane protein YraQ (UPF0718 family)
MIESFADWLIYDTFGLSSAGGLGPALQFFVYDFIKIGLLLIVITHLMGIFNSYFPVEKVRHFLATRNLFGFENFIAAFLGAVTPFCSCSSIPLFIGFVKGGIPMGVTLSFLITSPLINEVAVALFIGIFGLKVTLIYVASGLLLGTIGGLILGKMKLERFLTDWVKAMQEMKPNAGDKDTRSLLERMPEVSNEAFRIMKGIILYVAAGLAIGGAIHGYVPHGFFEQYMAVDNFFAVPISVILAVPMYTNASGAIPVIEALVGKGIPLGTALAFMMAVVGLSLPEAMLLKKVMKWQFLATFFGTVTVFIIVLGYFFNFIF